MRITNLGLTHNQSVIQHLSYTYLSVRGVMTSLGVLPRYS